MNYADRANVSQAFWAVSKRLEDEFVAGRMTKEAFMAIHTALHGEKEALLFGLKKEVSE